MYIYFFKLEFLNGVQSSYTKIPPKPPTSSALWWIYSSNKSVPVSEEIEGIF
jgi:hypothetical protein